jgi:hypothetical protein
MEAFSLDWLHTKQAEKERQVADGRGMGEEPNHTTVRKKAWFSINHSILTAVLVNSIATQFQNIPFKNGIYCCRSQPQINFNQLEQASESKQGQRTICSIDKTSYYIYNFNRI